MDDNKENKTAEKKEQSTAKAAAEKEKSVLEKAAETISGDNKLMETAMKILLSPVTFLVGAGVIVYCFFEMKKQKEEIEKLKNEIKEVQENYTHEKKKNKKLKALIENETTKDMAGLGFTGQQALPQAGQKKTYKSNYLD